MDIDDVLPSRFFREWAKHETKQYGAEAQAAYILKADDPQYRILIACDVGLLDLTTERSEHAIGQYRLAATLHTWPKVAPLTVATQTSHYPGGDPPLETRFTANLGGLDVEIEGPENEGRNRGLGDFVRACLRATAELGAGPR